MNVATRLCVLQGFAFVYTVFIFAWISVETNFTTTITLLWMFLPSTVAHAISLYYLVQAAQHIRENRK